MLSQVVGGWKAATRFSGLFSPNLDLQVEEFRAVLNGRAPAAESITMCLSLAASSATCAVACEMPPTWSVHLSCCATRSAGFCCFVANASPSRILDNHTIGETSRSNAPNADGGAIQGGHQLSYQQLPLLFTACPVPPSEPPRCEREHETGNGRPVHSSLPGKQLLRSRRRFRVGGAEPLAEHQALCPEGVACAHISSARLKTASCP